MKVEKFKKPKKFQKSHKGKKASGRAKGMMKANAKN